MSDNQKQQYASISRQVLAGVATLYGILTLAQVTPHEPSWFTGVLVALGPAFQLLEHSTLSPGGPPPPTVPVSATFTTGSSMVHAVETPIAPLTAFPTPPGSSSTASGAGPAGAPPSPIQPV
jgi:hypothetical protein